MNPYREVAESSFASEPHICYEDIATKLLKDHYFLTALELHTELVESGKELPQLREFFSNPGNFEQHVSRAVDLVSMHRSPSQATLDSLDTARYSEDGGGDRGGSGSDVAVLEFELRKARETINSLRANLTQFADGESGLEKSSKDSDEKKTLKPHEKRALNFLVNEYLLLQDYKLTSITFSDENPDQDFEDWDDVGLNMPRPSGLVSLFCGTSTKLSAPSSDAATQVELDLGTSGSQTDVRGSNDCISCQTHVDSETEWSHELLVQAEEINLLKQKIIALETDKLNYQKLYDAAIVSLNALSTPVSENKALDLKLPEEKLLKAQKEQLEIQNLPLTATENHYGSENSTHSATPEQFEMIENERTGHIKKESSNTSSYNAESGGDWGLRRGSVTTLDEALSIQDATEWTKVYECQSETRAKEMWLHSALPISLKDSILSWCCDDSTAEEPIANDILADFVNSDKPITLDGLLHLVADTLPRILPHTLVSRRCEAACLLACCVHLLASGHVAAAAAGRRAKLLQLLLTLLKKPTPAETRVICEAACLVVKWGGSGEVLSSIAELLVSRSSERRILASQICLSIAPYVPIELCTSLLFSLITLMCESSENEIRCMGLKSACLVCPIAENKYSQLENLMYSFLRDPLEKSVKDAVNVFVPILARTALCTEKFSSDFYSRLLTNLLKASTDEDWKTVLLYLDIIRVLVLATLSYVINVQLVKEVNIKNCDIKSMNYQEVSLDMQEYFMDVQCYVTDSNTDVKQLVVAMNCLIKEKPDVRWPELEWLVNVLKQLLQLSVTNKSLNHSAVYESLLTLFNTYSDQFGVHFTSTILCPIFMETINELERKMEKLESMNVESTVVVGIYAFAVLPTCCCDDVGPFLQKWLMYSSLRSLPVKLFAIPLKWLTKHKPDTLIGYLQHLRELTASSCESSSGVSIRVYIATLMTELLNTTEVNERCIETQLLPALLALLHDEDVAVRESAITLWGSVTRCAASQSLGVESRCWESMRHLVERGAVSEREAVRVAAALALLPDLTAHAESLLCVLCEKCPLTATTLAALTPSLQLMSSQSTVDFTPARRKLEEAVKNPSLAQYKAAIDALLHTASTQAASELPRAGNLHSAQEVGRRVTQMFHHSKTNINIPNIFKKKS